MIVIGGAHESLNAHKHEYKLTLKKRTGFCRIALETGSHLVPVFAFGENALFDQVDNPEGSTVRKIQVWMQNTLGFTLPLFHGRGIFFYDFGILPRRQELNTVRCCLLLLFFLARKNLLTQFNNICKTHTDCW